jgi:two-component system, LytTR family, sensor kinase
MMTGLLRRDASNAVALSLGIVDGSSMRSNAFPAWQMAVLTLGLGIFFTAQTVLMAFAARGAVNLEWDVLQEFVYWLVWAALSPVVGAAIARWPLGARSQWRTLAVHAAAALCLAAVQTSIAFGLHLAALQVVQPMTRTEVAAWISRIAPSLVWGTFMGTFLYAVLLAVDHAVRVRRLYAESQLDALRAQLRPHFLFNTLNAISVLTVDDPQTARTMLLRLSHLLRRAIDTNEREVTLQEELGYLEEYLDIQRARFGKRLQVSTIADAAVLGARLPSFLLQPLMENAMEHAVAARDRVTIVTLRAERAGNALRVAVEDNGPGPDAAATREGVGLRNTREILAQLYGRAGTVTLRGIGSPPHAGACTEVTIPFAR